MRLPSAATLIMACALTNAHAETSLEFAKLAPRIWSAFECASLAAMAGNNSEAERLFKSGYGNGTVFVNAALAGKIDRKDMDNVVPMAIVWSLSGPSVDFILGVIWSNAIVDSRKRIYEDDDGKFNDSNLWPILAENEFNRRNCSLL